MENVAVGDTHRHNVMAIVGHTRSQGTSLQAEAFDECHGRRVGLVSVDHYHLENVVFHIADDATVDHLGLNDVAFGDELSVKALYHLDLLAFIRHEEILEIQVGSLEDIGGQGLLVFEVRHAVFSHQHSFDIGLLGDKLVQVVDHDKVGIVALLQHAHGQMIMLNRIERGGFQHIHHIVSQLDSPAHQHIDMTVVQFIGMLVVGAEHQLVGMGGHQRDEGIEILGRAAFADEDLHAEADLLQGPRHAEALVVGGDTRTHILL